MALIPKVDANREYKLSGATLNSLIDAANSWANLRVEQIVSATEVTRLIRSPSGAVLRIAVPPGGGADGFSEVSLDFCHPTLGNCTGTFLVKDVTPIT
jgi:hypothetical protein